MEKKIGEMDIKELFELKTIVQTVNDSYRNELTTYAHLNGDMYLTNITPREKMLLEKQKKNMKLLGALDQLIDTKIEEYYV